MKRFLKKLKQINITDIGHLFLFLLAVIPAKFLKNKRKNLWLVCEYGKEARDNGYWFYKYVREEHPEQDIVYAIESNAPDEWKVKDLGEVIPYGSLKHWIYYLAAEVNISSHKGGKPNAAVCYLLEVYGILRNKRVFLQHGITKDLAEMFFYKNTKMRLFICGAKPEYDYVCDNFGYPKGYVVYTGFARFDNLLKPKQIRKQILFAPTWRRWLYETSSNPYENQCSDAENSEYAIKIIQLLNSKDLEILLEKYGYQLVFFPHRNMTSIFERINVMSANVHIVNWQTADLQQLMIESACMITDYSSTAMDFAYMNKPVIYYQFDQERFRKEHFEEGYFSYERDGFGEVVKDEKLLLEKVAYLLSHNMQDDDCYSERIEKFFPIRDQFNCERIFRKIKEIC